MSIKFRDRPYEVVVKVKNDTLTLSKALASDWISIELETNGNSNGEITLRGKEMAEHLRFMLGRILGDDQ